MMLQAILLKDELQVNPCVSFLPLFMAHLLIFYGVPDFLEEGQL